MKPFLLTVSTPGGEGFRGEVVKLVLRGVLGDLAVMAGHIPFVTAVKPCECVIELENGEEMKAKTEGGILTVSHDEVTLLSGIFTVV